MTHDIPRFGTPDGGLTWTSTGTHHGGPALMALAMAGQFPPAPEVPVDELLTRTADEPVDNMRAHLAEAEATIVRAQDALGSDHPVWWILDDYDGSMDSIKELVAERDAARAEAADLHAVAADAIAERDTLRAELDRAHITIAGLKATVDAMDDPHPAANLGHARLERDTLRARVAELEAQRDAAQAAYSQKVQDFAAETRRVSILVEALRAGGHGTDMGHIARFKYCRECAAMRQALLPDGGGTDDR